MRAFLLLLFFLPVFLVRAEYVLPYPSYMPGHKLYRISRVFDSLKSYWHWGQIAQEKYHQGLSDKYLVEAKTLFEYKQYTLAIDALLRSDRHFRNKEAAPAHTEVLTSLVNGLPETFVWQEEKGQPLTLPISDIISRSIEIRNE